MESQRDVFEASGPIHLTSVNWHCPHHQRSVAASLVQGAYVLERDRQYDRQSHEALAPAWWESFHFELFWKLVDDADLSVFGAIYRYKPPATFQRHTISGAPRFVLVFRGTVLTRKSGLQDLKLNWHFFKNDLHETSRCRKAMQAVRTSVAAIGYQSLWIAGHSLGAAMAILAAKNMGKEGLNLKAFLFNPPFLWAPTERIKDEKIKDEKVKQGIRRGLINAGLKLAVNPTVKDPRRKSDLFKMLSSWLPHLFVNEADDICSDYIVYFEHRQKKEEIGEGCIGKLLPSAKLTVNSSPAPGFRHAHGIHQWWRTDLNLHSTEYRHD